MDIKIIDGWKCYFYNCAKDEKPFIIYWGVGKDSETLVWNIVSYLNKTRKKDSYILIAFEIPNWNDYFSPWKIVIDNNNVFNGFGQRTLDWIYKNVLKIEDYTLKSELIFKTFSISKDYIENYIHNSRNRRYIMGYSLSGLFALWAFYESKLFGGVASCSGSLWYPGWQEYVISKKIGYESIIYMSLGKKEEKISNFFMKEVGKITHWQYDILENNDTVINSDFVWHDGGHFHQIDKRILNAIEWLLNNGSLIE